MKREPPDFRWDFDQLEKKTSAELRDIRDSFRRALADRLQARHALCGSILYYQTQIDEYDKQD